jgi:hypothetical protein
MDSESSNEYEDSSDDDSSDENDQDSNLEEESTTLFEKFSTSPRNWKKGNFNPRLFTFDPSDCGLSSRIKNLTLETPLDFFELLFDRKLLGIIVKETNRFHANYSRASHSHSAPWIDTTIDEMYTFLATVMLMPHTKKNRICDYWSTDHLVATPIFAELFTRDRFRALLTSLHFNDNQNDISEDALYKVRPVIDELKRKFFYCLNPYKNLCIDESLTLWKGRLHFKQYIPSKRHKFGIKIFALCDCETGFIIDFIVYTGSNTTFNYQAHLGVTGSIVITLLERFLNKGHSLFVDNYYSSPILFEYLHQYETGACGTVRENRTGLPIFEEVGESGTQVFYHTNNLLALRWHDKNDVTMLSTIHEPIMVSTGKIHYATQQPKIKPLCVKEYNENRGLVDKYDMQISFSECIRRSVKWYKKFFFHLMDLTIYNAYVLYKLKKNINLRLASYQLEVIREIIEKYGSQVRSSIGRPSEDNPLRLTARHFPSRIPSTDTQANPRRKCFVCANTLRRAKSRRDTSYECVGCDVGLCLTDCFEDYHTLKAF